MPKLPVGPIRRAKLLQSMSRNDIARDFRQVLDGIYVRADQPIDFTQRSRALAVAHPAGVLGGWSAAVLLGYRYVPDDAVPEIVLPAPARRRKGVVMRYDVLPDEEREDVYGYEVTTHLRTAFDLGRRLEFDTSVEIVDGMCNIGICEPSLVADLATRHPGVRGIKQLRAAVDLADRGAESPWETKTRLLIVRAGLPRPVTQHLVVNDSGRPIARADMAWLQYRVIVEYDGDDHRDRVRFARDARRTNTLELGGWRVVVATKELVTKHRHELIARIRQNLQAGGYSS